MDWILDRWTWWFSGLMIGLVVPLLYYFAGRDFGISTSLQQIGAMCKPARKLDYLRTYDRQDGFWTVIFVAGIAIGGFVGAHLLAANPIEFLPPTAYTPSGAMKLVAGGILIGFGARYANGCTSGHSITGIANLNWPSLLATVCFFIGGIAVTWMLRAWLL